MRYLIGFAGALLLAVIVGGLIIWTGAYNFAATDAHASVVRSLIDTALHKSVASRADDLQAPEFTDADLRHGAREFAEYCVHCHGAPGVKPHEWTTGMRPNPPPLSRAAREWSVEETFWIVKHGIKMSGMPAFGDTESEKTMWHIAGFVNRLPQMSAAEYARLQAQLASEEGGGSKEGGGHGHGSGHQH